MADDPADRLVARAIESVLDQVPGAVDSGAAEASSAKLQPWAETAAPVGRNKRPLEELLADLEERVAGAPGARANLPRGRHPGLTFFDRFGRGGSGRVAAEPAGDGEGRRRRRRRGGGGAVTGAQPVGAVAAPPAGQPEKPAGTGGRRRSRRGRGGGGGSDGGASPRSAAPTGGATGRGGAGQQGRPRPAAGEGAQQGGTGQAARAGGSGRRRRGRRGRGGGGPAGAG